MKIKLNKNTYRIKLNKQTSSFYAKHLIETYYNTNNWTITSISFENGELYYHLTDLSFESAYELFKQLKPIHHHQSIELINSGEIISNKYKK